MKITSKHLFYRFKAVIEMCRLVTRICRLLVVSLEPSTISSRSVVLHCARIPAMLKPRRYRNISTSHCTVGQSVNTSSLRPLSLQLVWAIDPKWGEPAEEEGAVESAA